MTDYTKLAAMRCLIAMRCLSANLAMAGLCATVDQICDDSDTGWWVMDQLENAVLDEADEMGRNA